MTPGSVLDSKYEIIQQLGKGGMGAVYAARNVGTGARVAIKVIAAEGVNDRPELQARFHREARAAGAIESQHVARVLDAGRDAASGNPYLVMELLAGQDLEHTIRSIGPLPPEVVLRIAAQASVGLAKAHEAGVVHRDIKSANVFLARRDEGEVVVKLLDFGIAKVDADCFATAAGMSLTQSGSMLGSPYYMSPEQAKAAKDIDHRTDLWSLGIAMYEALTGTTPFGYCETIGPLIMAIYSEEPPPVRDCGEGSPTYRYGISTNTWAVSPSVSPSSFVGPCVSATMPDWTGQLMLAPQGGAIDAFDLDLQTWTYLGPWPNVPQVSSLYLVVPGSGDLYAVVSTADLQIRIYEASY